MAQAFSETNLMKMRPVVMDGYTIPLGTVFTVTTEADETNDFYFGTVDSVTIRTATRATIGATFREAKEDYRLLQLLSGYSPSATTVRVYEPESVEVALIRNIWNADKTDYLGGEFYGSASCLIPVATGDAGVLGERVLTFTCDTPIEVFGRGFSHEVVALGAVAANGPWTGQLTATVITQVPTQFSGPIAGCYAVYVAISTASGANIRKKGPNITMKPIEIVTGTVTAAGVVSITQTQRDEAVMTGTPIRAAVVTIAGASGVAGTGSQVQYDGLYDS